MASKKIRSKSKAAQATAEARKARGDGPGASSAPAAGGRVEGVPEAVDWESRSGRGGLISGMRTGIADVADGGKKKGGMLNTILWVLLAVAAVAFVLGDVSF